MKVSELAEELELPASAVLEQCQRFGIDAPWVGAELGGADVIILRAELASADLPLDLTGADDDVAVPTSADDVAAGPDERGAPGAVGGEAAPIEDPVVDASASEAAPADPSAGSPADAGTGSPSPVASPVGTSPAGSDAPEAPVPTPIPPTAVGSMPELIDEVTPPQEGAPAHAGGFRLAGPEAAAAVAQGTKPITPRPPPSKKRLDKHVRRAIGALVIALVAFIGSNFVENIVAIGGLGLIVAVALLVLLVSGLRGQHHVRTHPERLTGLWLALVLIVVGAVAVAGLGLIAKTVVGDAPATDAPFSVGDLSVVKHAKWGYARVSRMAEDKFNQPAKDEGSCWKDNNDLERDNRRVELGTEQVNCRTSHQYEVSKVFNIDRDADSTYPGVASLLKAAKRKCWSTVVAIKLEQGSEKTKVNVDLRAEYPTAKGWSEGDHDVACVITTADPRSGSLLPDT